MPGAGARLGWTFGRSRPGNFVILFVSPSSLKSHVGMSLSSSVSSKGKDSREKNLLASLAI